MDRPWVIRNETAHLVVSALLPRFLLLLVLPQRTWQAWRVQPLHIPSSTRRISLSIHHTCRVRLYLSHTSNCSGRRCVSTLAHRQDRNEQAVTQLTLLLTALIQE